MSRTHPKFLVSSTLALAVSLVAGGHAVRAQSLPAGAFQGTPTIVVPGSVSIINGTGTSTITINSPSAVINWNSTDAANNFLPNGNIATFVNNPSTTADFAVLNNITPNVAGQAIQLNGTIISQLQTAAGASTTGGTVYFFSPDGILVGPSAVINVGNLGLTTSPVAYNATTGAFGATGSVIRNGAQTVAFGQSSNAAAQVFVNTGARINANSSDGSYVAIVAPRIQNLGTINVSGNAALVSADAATITFSPSGLYNISVDVGTSATGTVINNGGTITGSTANTAAGGPAHQIYFVTAPKNTMIGILIGQGSNLGFDVAGAANTSGNSIVLSAGYDINAGTANLNLAPKGTGPANVNVTNSNVTSALNVTASNNAQVDGSGGGTMTLASDVTVNGGKTAFLGAFSGSSLTANGAVFVNSIDPGITAAAGTSVTGGTAQIFAQGGTVTLNGNTRVTAIATGRASVTPGMLSGDGTGGNATVLASGGGRLTTLGGLDIIAEGDGGRGTNTGISSGNGTGGRALLQALNGSSISIGGRASVTAEGYGANVQITDNPNTNSFGANGRGGSASILASDSNATITLKGSTFVGADGYGGSGSCGIGCTVDAGSGYGGSAQVIVQRGGTTPGGGSAITTAINASGNAAGLDLSAAGYGARSNASAGGSGVGGNVNISVDNGNTISLAGRLDADASGYGGDQNSSVVAGGPTRTGGTGTGGNVGLQLQTGDTFSVDGTTHLTAQGYGGRGNGSGSSGGAGMGGGACDATGTTCIAGGAFITSNGGNGTFNMGVKVDASGFGGSPGVAGTTGSGGAGTGGFAQIRIGSGSLNTNNATLTFNGPDSFVSAVGMGGRGYPGGVGTGGSAIVQTFYGTIQGTGLLVDSSGTGGSGSLNGKGGDGFGGFSSIQARNNPFGTATITLNSASLLGIGNGGRGGDSINVSLAGGAGGVGNGGSTGATAQAGDGKLTITGALSSFAGAFGGAGGNGADDAVLAGGNGGAGGAAIGTGPNGNGSQNGTVSGLLGTTNAGSARFGSVAISVAAQGGAGGTGGNVNITGGPKGNGGAGGDAIGGFGGLLVRGSTVTVTGNTQLSGDAFGGNGGQGAVVGNGGNASIGGIGGAGGGLIFVTATNRFQVPTQRGTLIAGPITGSVAAIGGTGGVAGTSTVGDSPINFTVTNSDVTATSLSLLASAASVAPNALPSVVQLTGGTANLGSAFQFNSAGPITVGLDTATLNAGFVGLSGSDWILPATPPVLAGTINATTGASFSSGNNIVTYANINFNYAVAFNAIGNLQFGNVNAVGDFSSFSGGMTTLGSVNASANSDPNALSAGNVDISAGKDIAVGKIQAAGFVSLDNTFGRANAAGIGDISVAGIVAGRDLGVFSNGSIVSTGPIQTGANVNIEALGAVTIGNVSAGLVNPSTITGDTYEIVVRSGAALVSGNLASQTDIGLLSNQTISTGTLSGQDMLLLGHGTTSFGAINAGSRVLIADASMAALGGTFGGQFDKNAVFAGVPVQLAGSITVNGAVQAAQFFTAATTQGFTSAAINTGTDLAILAAGAVQTGSLISGGFANVASGSLVTGPVTTKRYFNVSATGQVNVLGPIQAGANVQIVSQGGLTVGDVSSGIVNPSTTTGDYFSTILSSGGALIAGNLRAATELDVIAQGPITTGTISADYLGLLAGAAATTGPINARTGVAFGNASQVSLGGTFGPNYKASLIFSTPGIAGLNAGGSITVNGAINSAGGLVLGGSSQNFNSGNISAILVALGAQLITTGSINAPAAIYLVSGQTLVGALNTKDLLLLSADTVSTGSINTTGRALIADASMYALGRTPTGFNANNIYAAAPVPTAGAITINGNVNSSSTFTAATQQGFTSGAITTGTDLTIIATGAVQAGLLNAGGFADVSSGALNTGPVTTRRYFRVRANGPVSVAGAIQAGAQVQLSSAAAITTGNIVAGSAPQSTVPGDFFDINIDVSGSLSTGNLQTSATAVLHSIGSIQAGAISAGSVGILGGSSVSTATINATDTVFANQSFYAGQGTGPYNFQALRTAINTQQPVVVANVGTAGSISINGSVTGNSLTAYSAQDITVTGPVQMSTLAILRGGGNVTAGSIQGGIGAQAIAGGNVLVGDVTGGSLVPGQPLTTSVVLNAGGTLTAGILKSFNTALVTAQQAIQTGSITTIDLLGLGHGAITVGPIVASGRVLFADASMRALGNTTATTNGVTRSVYDPNLVFNSPTVSSAGPITINGAMSAASLTVDTLGAFTSGAITTSNFIDVTTGGNALVNGAIQSGQETNINAGGGISVGNVTAGANSGTKDPIPFSIGLVANGGALVAGNLSGTQSVGLAASGSVTTGTLTGTNLLVGGGSTIDTGAISMTGQALLASFAMLPIGGTPGGNGTYDASLVFAATPIAAPGAITVKGTINTGQFFHAATLQGFTSGSITAGTDLSLTVGGAAQVGALGAGGPITINANSLTLGGGVSTPGSLTIATVQALTAQNLTIGGNVSLSSQNALMTGNVTSSNGSVALSAGTTLAVGAISAATTATLTSIGAMQTGAITAGNQVTISADSFVLGSPGTPGTIVTTGGGLAISTTKALVVPSLSIFGNVMLASQTALTTGNIASTAGSATLNSGGTLNAGVINTTNGIQLTSVGAATVQGLTSSGAISFNSQSTFANTGQTTSAARVIGQSTGAMSLGNVTVSGGAGTVELASFQGNLTAGRVSATTDIATIAGGGSLSLSQVTGRDILLLASSNVQVGTVTAGAVTNQATGAITSATGRVLIANSSASPAGGKFGTFNYNAVFASAGGTVINTNPPWVGGTVTVSGTVNAGSFGAYAQGAMTGQVINAFGSLEVESGGLVTVGQRWTSPDISILSNDIAIQPAQVLQTITTTAGLSSGTTGTITLASLNQNGAFIGDGLTAGQGYALSNAEVGLVQSGSLTIGAAVAPNLTTTMTIGTLSLTGPQAGSNVDNRQSGAVQFVTGNPQTLVPSGTIRVTGAVTAKGFLTANQLQFETGTFELDTASGSITVTDSSNALAGGISISADHIHIAAASILDKLRVDPLYATRITDLNTPPTQPLAGPVLSASQLFFAPTQTLYIQNTGTAAVQAGFLVPLAGLTIKTLSSQTTETNQTATRVSLVINGQFVGTSSTSGTGQSATSPASITGATAFQQFIQQTKPTGITADSQFNGCLIAAGSCAMAATPTPDLSTQIQVLQTPALPSAPAVVEAVQQASAEITADSQDQEQSADTPTESEQKDEKEAKDSAKAPIAPPAPMIDTRPLSPPVSVDEPVAGGGNPALFGIGVAATQTEGGDK